jgi:C4-dicarboxylate transporter DctM subunit
MCTSSYGRYTIHQGNKRDVNPIIISGIGFALVIVLMLVGMPVGFSMAIVGFVGFVVVNSWHSALTIIAIDVYDWFSSYTLVVVPMFVFMGTLAFYSGEAKRLFASARSLLGSAPGGLAMTTTLACALFGAICGSTIASAAAMGKMALPEMKRYGYKLSLATGCVAVSGTVAILIPPSTVLIIYGVLTEQSIGKLFIAGLLPGALMTILLMAFIYILSKRNPDLAPGGPKISLKEKALSLVHGSGSLIIFILVIGGLFGGWFTPSEAGSLGAFSVLILALARRELDRQALFNSLWETVRITAMVYVIIAGGVIFGHFITVLGIPRYLSGWLSTSSLPGGGIMACIIIIYFLGGFFMDSLAMIVVTIPVFFPIVQALGFDPLWFGVIIVLLVEIGAVTPPVGINVYVVKGIDPEVTMETIFRGVMPFLVPMVITLAILALFPQVVTFLPGFMRY